MYIERLGSCIREKNQSGNLDPCSFGSVFVLYVTITNVFKVHFIHLRNGSLGSFSRRYARPPLYVKMVYRYTNHIKIASGDSQS